MKGLVGSSAPGRAGICEGAWLEDVLITEYLTLEFQGTYETIEDFFLRLEILSACH